ncbi:MAG: HAD family phosphatase [Alphaproteobacteria bacterium]|jgi:HAD superfamily hydrolase (TIGR01509 family)|nr:HAD family phosphatase [Alphaproteobacteria bacterium]
MSDFDLLIFDCDGTLVDSEYLNNYATIQLLHGEGLTQYDMDYAFEHFVGLRLKHILDGISKETGHIFPADIIERYIALVEKLAPSQMKTISGALELVAEASKRVKICVVSNGQRDNVLSSLEMANVRKYFEESYIFTGLMAPNPKPAPDLFLLAAERLNAQTNKCLVIEDSVAGVTGAVAAGMRTFGFVGTHTDQSGYAERLKKAGAVEIFTSLIHIREQLFR